MENYLHYDVNYPTRFGPFIERWKGVPGFEGKYWISDYARIKTYKKGIVRGNRRKDGYMWFCFSDISTRKLKSDYIHRVVATCFLDNPENKPCINHKLGIHNLNCVWEIEWVTHKENNIHACRVLGKAPTLHNDRKVRFFKQKEGVKTECIGIKKTARELNIKIQGIQSVLSNKKKSYGGYKFTYE